MLITPVSQGNVRYQAEVLFMSTLKNNNKKNPLYPKFKNTMETNTLIFVSKIGQTHFKQASNYMVMEQKSLFWY